MTDPAQSLDEQESELLKQLAEIQARKREATLAKLEEQKRAELERPISIHVLELSGAMVIIKNDYREDLLNLLRGIKGRAYRGVGENSIPLADWPQFETAAAALKNVSIVYTKQAEAEIKHHLTMPVWLVELDKRNFKVNQGPRSNAYDVHNIPGAEWVKEGKFYKVPLSEGWRLYERLAHIEGVVYTEEAQKYIVDQAERRASLDKIAQLERGVIYLDYEMNGHKLRPFQEVGCEFIDAAGGRTLLADEMGLGKTWQALAYAIKNNLRTIVICPASLKPNWSREIFKLTGKRPTILQGSEPTKYDMIKLLADPNQFTIINYDIIGRKTEYDEVKKDTEGYDHVEHKVRWLWMELINLCKPDLVILDESHYIKNVDSQRSQAARQIKAPRVLCMTGTPILNRPGEYWAVLTLLAPTTFPSYETFLRQYTYDGKTARNVEELREILKTIMIRRLKRDVLPQLPPINRINEYHELSSKAEKLYTKVLQGVYEKVSEYSVSGQTAELSVTNILAQIMRLKQVCAIDKIDHVADLATQLYDQTDESEKRKVLIFSQFKAVAYSIAQRLGGEARCFVRRGPKEFVTADNDERDRLVQEFQTNPDVHYLVVTEKTTKEGHNITEAGHVIFADLFWTPAGHDQAEGRAYGRLSDMHSINSYYVIAQLDSEEDSIEDWIMELLAGKQNTIEQVVEGVEQSRDASIAMALIEKIKQSMWTRK